MCKNDQAKRIRTEQMNMENRLNEVKINKNIVSTPIRFATDHFGMKFIIFSFSFFFLFPLPLLRYLQPIHSFPHTISTSFFFISSFVSRYARFSIITNRQIKKKKMKTKTNKISSKKKEKKKCETVYNYLINFNLITQICVSLHFNE